MKIAKLYVSEVAQSLIETNDMAAQAFEEVSSSILDNVTSGLQWYFQSHIVV